MKQSLGEFFEERENKLTELMEGGLQESLETESGYDGKFEYYRGRLAELKLVKSKLEELSKEED